MAAHKFYPNRELSICMVCGLGEGELTTDCPGERAGSRGEDTYAGKLDFRNGAWVKEPNPTNQTWNADNVKSVCTSAVSATHRRRVSLSNRYLRSGYSFGGIAAGKTTLTRLR